MPNKNAINIEKVHETKRKSIDRYFLSDNEIDIKIITYNAFLMNNINAPVFGLNINCKNLVISILKCSKIIITKIKKKEASF